MKKINLIVFIMLVFIFLIDESGLANIIVFAPHPDDEALMFSGIIYRALAKGEPVKVVIITNGDANSVDEGYVRQSESVNAMNVLGIVEYKIIFLGYPNSGLDDIYNYYTSSNDIYTSPTTGMSETYGNRGLGGSDYHTFMFGQPGKYNKPNILMDLESILSDFLPDHVFVTSEFDTHQDHEYTYYYIRDALINISRLYSNYRPIIHKTLIHGGDDPLWPNAIDPKSLFVPPPIMSNIPLIWDLRESINVPLVMQSTNFDENLKRKVILEYVTQVPRGGIHFQERFLHKDEFFWAENIFGTNTPPVVEAGGDQAANGGSLVTLDGTGSLDPDGDLLSYRWIQTQGTSVILSDPSSPIPSFNAPTGLLANETLEFGLVVNDGEFESIMDTTSVTVASNYANIAPLSSAAASSEQTGTLSFASAAIDGYVDGSPNDESREWASDGELADAWITLSWPEFYVVDRIILYDRINSTDQIIDATLNFSDGSFIDVGPLLNDGSGSIINFPMKNIFSVTLTVNEAFGQNAGLAEIEVYGVKTDIVPEIIVTPIAYDFNNVRLFTSSASQTFTIFNTGTADLVVDTITLTGADANEFSIINNIASGQNIPPSESRSFDVLFSPESTGAKSAAVKIQSLVPGDPIMIPLTGTGVVSNIVLSPTSHDFGSIELSTSSPPHAFTATNTGTGDLVIESVSISGPDAAEFSVITDMTMGQPIGPSESTSFEVIFSPSSSTSKSAKISVLSNDPDTPTVNISISGTGITSGGGCSITTSSENDDFSSAAMVYLWLMLLVFFKLKKFRNSIKSIN